MLQSLPAQVRRPCALGTEYAHASTPGPASGGLALSRLPTRTVGRWQEAGGGESARYFAQTLKLVVHGPVLAPRSARIVRGLPHGMAATIEATPWGVRRYGVPITAIDSICQPWYAAPPAKVELILNSGW